MSATHLQLAQLGLALHAADGVGVAQLVAADGVPAAPSPGTCTSRSKSSRACATRAPPWPPPLCPCATAPCRWPSPQPRPKTPVAHTHTHPPPAHRADSSDVLRELTSLSYVQTPAFFSHTKAEGSCLHTAVCTSLTSLVHTHTHTSLSRRAARSNPPPQTRERSYVVGSGECYGGLVGRRAAGTS